MKVEAAVLRCAGEPLVIETLDLAAPRPGEVLVRMAAVGVCRSDWHVMTGDTEHPLPVVPGHEGAGIVVQIGEQTGSGPAGDRADNPLGVDTLRVGDHVTLNWAPACVDCFYCNIGRPGLCEAYVDAIWAGTMLDGQTRFTRNGEPVYHYCGLGCFADHVVVAQQSCVRVAREVPLAVAALIGCAVTTGVGAVLNTAAVEPGSAVAVFGAGGVGLSMIMAARLAGATTIVAVDAKASKLALAREFGATDLLEAGAAATAEIRRLTGGRGADYAFEAVGVPAVQEQCFEAARPGGTVVLAGLSPMGSETNLPGAVITRQEKSVLGSYYGSADPAKDFPRYAELYQRGQLDLDRLISRSYRLEEINQAYAAMIAGETARGLIVFDS
jgi:S-(hydroxymethyl)glutathione dehydrogenase/alcohol dehydrogenase